MSGMPWGGVVPQDVRDQIDALFPVSQEKRKIGYTLMFYNHRPGRKEMTDIAREAGRSLRTVQEVVRVLSESNLFTTEFGSVPLYKYMERLAPTLMVPDARGLQGGREGGEDEEDGGEEPDEWGEDEAPGEEEGDAPEPAQQGAGPAQPLLMPRVKMVPGLQELDEVRGELARMSQRQDRFEAQVDQSLRRILGKLEEPPRPLAGAVPAATVVEANPVTVQADPPEVEQEPVAEAEEGDADLDNTAVPLKDLVERSPEQVLRFLNDLRQRSGMPEYGEIPASDVSFRKVLLSLPNPLFTLYDQERYMGTIPQEWTFADYIGFLGKDRMKLVYGLQAQGRLPAIGGAVGGAQGE